MRYRFTEFEFDSKSLVLLKNDQAVPIRHNEAKVLTLLLEQAKHVMSKEDILSHVWQDKVVSEQAIFQNISHLRALFGNVAIKTFPKRGYQWQLDFEIVAPAPLDIALHSEQESPVSAIPQTQPYWLYVALVALVICIIGIINWPSEPIHLNDESAIKIAYIPFSNISDNTQEQAQLVLQDSELFDFTPLAHLETTQFLTSAELEYPHLSQSNPFILTGNIRVHQQLTHLDFSIKGPFDEWQGQLAGSSTKDVLEQLRQHLAQTLIYDLLSKPQAPELKQAKLSIAYQQAPDDLIILGKLILSYLRTQELEKAMVMADKLAEQAQSQEDPQQIGNAYLFQSQILTSKKLYDLSAHKLALAIEQFEKINDLNRQADAWHSKSWLHYQQDDYAAIKITLLRSAQLALDAQDIPRELDALTYLSVLAHKKHQEDDKYLYLQQAENKMREYQLPIYHFAKVPFHYAIFAENPADKEPHLQRVLEFTALTPDHWVAQSSRRQLMTHYINFNRLGEAQGLVDDLTADNVYNSYLKTVLAQAKQQTEAFINHAKRTFEQAQLSGELSIGLDIALLLCSASNQQVNYDFYSQYISENAPSYWRQANETELLALKI
ncbi:winged helix-turn-helix domain-containing protein [Shewanella eurypsychrophilus]|uniref:Winged helix-turn-helix domain-containing protein n=1 Tax=Shewanella eurypsychrophilus TaxID=2593656 RepID=A0ABX6VC20_9GAMM|nr:transcriptional regulator [Shewanella sp. YLB-09]QPG59363.1 winged helix-turn-helix domain-containing protein [Shewanella eurypsychrophilus]